MKNLIEILKSSRFQQMAIIAVLQILVVFNVIDTFQGEQLINIISVLIGASVTIRTIDRNTGDAKVNTTTVSIPSNVSSVSASTSK